MKNKIIKSKKFWIILIVLIAIIVFIIPKGEKQISYDTNIIERKDILQTVDATGKLESANGVSLRFQASGNLGRLNVKEGDVISKGKLIASLHLPELDAAIAQAQAALNQKLAGATEEQININRKQLESAIIALEKAEKNYVDIKKLGEENLSSANFSLEKAENSLIDATRLADESLKAKYNYAVSSLDDANIKIFNSYALVDSLKSSYFNNSDQQGLRVKSILENAMQTVKDDSENIVEQAKKNSDSQVENLANQMISNLDIVLSSLTEVRSICDLYTYKTSIPDTTRTSLDTQKSVISGIKNSLTALVNEINVLKIQNENNLNNARNSINSIKNEISVLKVQNTNSLNSAQASIDTAKANVSIQEASLNSIVASPREVDIAQARAALDQANANKAKALLYAPITGKVAKINKSVGELVSPNDVILEIISPHQEVVIDVPETDVVKLNIGDEAIITYDALGSDTKFLGEVIIIEPSSTDIQGVVYYKVKIDLKEDDERVKPGMTANVIIETEKRDSAIGIPSRAVINKESKRFVRVLEDGNVLEKEVVLGIRGDGGILEVVSGLKEGEELILRTVE